jgi:hypothetical protein
VIVKGWVADEPVGGFGLTLLMLGAPVGATTLNVNTFDAWPLLLVTCTDH